jgi:Leucine-rich repeat (LRR) protein
MCDLQLLLAANKLAELPDEICELALIKDADMSTNLLHSIPAKVRLLTLASHA